MAEPRVIRRDGDDIEVSHPSPDRISYVVRDVPDGVDPAKVVLVAAPQGLVIETFHAGGTREPTDVNLADSHTEAMKVVCDLARAAWAIDRSQREAEAAMDALFKTL